MNQSWTADLVARFGVLGAVAAAAVALVTALTPPAAPAGKASAPTAKAADAADKGNPAPKGVPQTHVEFLTRIGSPPWASKLGVTGAVTDFVVVCVPDPVGTHFGFWFDQTVEAVNRAMLDGDDLTLDRHWYPAATGTGRTRVNGWEREPGVVVYRGTGDPTRRRVALLVGESPVSGPHPDALAAALDVAAGGPSGVRSASSDRSSAGRRSRSPCTSAGGRASRSASCPGRHSG